MAASIILPIIGVLLVFGVAIPLMVYLSRIRKKQREAEGAAP